MAVFQDALWGFELTYPDAWVQRSQGNVAGFARNGAAFNHVGDVDEQVAHLLVRGEWNGRRQPIAPLWNQHITKASIMQGAKKLGASPFSMGGANGFEAEIQLPRRQNRRLWMGILARDTIILHFMVTHPKKERAEFEPPVTKIISSLRFLDQIDGLNINEMGIPLPPNYESVAPVTLVPDAKDASWRAYNGNSDIGALQAFYFRELPQHGWEISEFIPFPNQAMIGFARLQIHKEGMTATLGILPAGEKGPVGQIVIKVDPEKYA